ncbi:MAG TPA: hypothetical protein VG870_11090 [Chitinophagaceae bacterium]|nr:hypothetical protein [Chitinophagaceae bacterium]
MEQHDYSCAFAVAQSPQEAWDAICRVNDWWTRNMEGSARHAGDQFRVRFAATYVEFRVVEQEPTHTMKWLVTDCHLAWLDDKKEWKDTQLVFELETTGPETHVRLTHLGLVPRIPCFEDCRKGWDFYAGVSLRQLIQTGTGSPDAGVTARTDAN